MPKNLVLGVLAYNLWTYADNDNTDPKVNALTLQPFINVNFPNGWALGYSPIISANWENDKGDEWTVPLGFSLSKVNRIGRTPVSLQLAYYNNVKRVSGAGQNQLRFQFALLYPAAPPAAPATNNGK
jgi:hypothetical protein